MLIPRGSVVKELDCSLDVTEFELKSRYYVQFWTITLGKGMDPFMLPAMGKIVSLRFFYKDGFGIKMTHKGWYAIK